MKSNAIPHLIRMTTSSLSASFQNGDWARPGKGGLIEFLFLIAVFVGVLTLAYYATKWIAAAKLSGSGRNLSVIESIGVGHQSVVALIRAGKKIFLVGIAKDKVSLLSELDENSIVLPDGKPPVMYASFEKHLKKLLNRNKDVNGQSSIDGLRHTDGDK